MRWTSASGNDDGFRSSGYPVSRRGVAGLVAGAMTCGCSALPGDERPTSLPILTDLSVQNRTGHEREYRVRIGYGSKLDSPVEVAHEQTGTVDAGQRVEVDADWEAQPGRYEIELSVDDEEWITSDITERLTQAERVCYAQIAAIESATEVTFWTNPDARCPER